MWFCFCSGEKSVGNIVWTAPDKHDGFVNSVKAIEQQWVSVLGRTLTPVFYRKMPLRLAKRLSAGFQDKESKPQVHIRIHPYRLKNHLKLVNGVG